VYLRERRTCAVRGGARVHGLGRKGNPGPGAKAREVVRGKRGEDLLGGREPPSGRMGTERVTVNRTSQAQKENYTGGRLFLGLLFAIKQAAGTLTGRGRPTPLCPDGKNGQAKGPGGQGPPKRAESNERWGEGLGGTCTANVRRNYDKSPPRGREGGGGRSFKTKKEKKGVSKEQ